MNKNSRFFLVFKRNSLLLQILYVSKNARRDLVVKNVGKEIWIRLCVMSFQWCIPNMTHQVYSSRIITNSPNILQLRVAVCHIHVSYAFTQRIYLSWWDCFFSLFMVICIRNKILHKLHQLLWLDFNSAVLAFDCWEITIFIVIFLFEASLRCTSFTTQEKFVHHHKIVIMLIQNWWFCRICSFWRVTSMEIN